MIIHDIAQGGDEWFNVRKGKMTASNATAIGNNGKGLETYIVEIMAQEYSSGEKEQFTSKHIERGNELEPIARSIYELQEDVTVQEVGFIELDKYTGCSPDGLINDAGGIEIKCIDDIKYFKHLINGEKEVDSGHVWQVQMCLYITGRKWWDLVYYNPNYEKSMCIYRIEPDIEKHDKIREGLESGKKQILAIKSKLK